MPKTIPTRPSPTSATRSLNPSRAVASAPDCPRSASITRTWWASHPNATARSRSSYCRIRLSVFAQLGQRRLPDIDIGVPAQMHRADLGRDQHCTRLTHRGVHRRRQQCLRRSTHRERSTWPATSTPHCGWPPAATTTALPDGPVRGRATRVGPDRQLLSGHANRFTFPKSLARTKDRANLFASTPRAGTPLQRRDQRLQRPKALAVQHQPGRLHRVSREHVRRVRANRPRTPIGQRDHQ
jgi:hypothetical protein